MVEYGSRYWSCCVHPLRDSTSEEVSQEQVEAIIYGVEDIHRGAHEGCGNFLSTSMHYQKQDPCDLELVIVAEYEP